ncbi:MAG TPA: ABC transporter ATP-binding protein [Candidatus Dormibacteraeota bacterium]|jgi:peptide/nickel transport system ATP-binding protein|nr:ABC transporter ATP-binding protein [Candidatus Dormibacteraeota bacterium]
MITAAVSAAQLGTPAAGTAPPLLAVSGLCVDAVRRDSRLPLVEDVSLTVRSGQMVGLVGESGSGKSVTAMSIVRLLPIGLRITGGSVEFGGRDLTTLDSEQMRAVRGREIGVIFQDPQNSLDPAFSVGNQLVEAIRAHTEMPAKQAHARAVELLDEVGIQNPKQRIEDFPHQFSGGMAQRVMIALAICNRPRLLIADEPTTALDVTVQAQILELLRRLQREHGMALLLVSHDLSVIAEMCDQVTVMYAGQIAEQGSVARVFAHPAHPYTEALLGAHPRGAVKGDTLLTIPGSVPSAEAMPGGCRFHPRCAYAVETCATTLPEIAAPADDIVVRCLRHAELSLAGLREAARVPPAPTPPPPGDAVPLLEVGRLRRNYTPRAGGRFGRGRTVVAAVDDVSFEIAPGETLGLVGESGAGKSTVGRLVLGLTPVTGGTVRFQGADLSQLHGNALRDARARIQVVFQNPYASLDPTMTVGDSVGEPLDIHGVGRGERERRVDELLDQVGLKPVYARRYPHELSGGQRQRVAIARALALDPALIVCDEPISSLDVSTQAQVINLFKDIQRRLGVAYLFVGHDLSVVYQISDRIAVMYMGRVVEIGSAHEVYHHPKHPYTQALLSAVLSIDPAHPKLGGVVKGEPSTHAAGQPGCPFASRCASATEHCRTVTPEPALLRDGTTVWCHLFDKQESVA